VEDLRAVEPTDRHPAEQHVEQCIPQHHLAGPLVLAVRRAEAHGAAHDGAPAAFERDIAPFQREHLALAPAGQVRERRQYRPVLSLR
jgi:hypothetical protein